TGVSADRCRDEGKGVVYAKWARDVVTPWLDRGWRVAMWADIVNSHPEALDIIPDEVLLIPWTYESPAMEAKFADTEGYEIRSDAGFASTARLVAN
ncbi:beta-N-acetylhexosaminidase, partial [Cutibacterium acnes subsp. acnes]|nr:beta-N-acetylhexosaminidase [Cutibacterium acnes subsp. acnes]